MIFIFAASPLAFAGELSMSIGKNEIGKNEIEWITLKTIKVKKKLVYILAYTSPRHGTFVRAVPKTFYNDIFTQAKKWEKAFAKDRRLAAVLACTNPIDVKTNNITKTLCLDAMSMRARKKFFSWFNEQAQLAMIVIR